MVSQQGAKHPFFDPNLAQNITIHQKMNKKINNKVKNVKHVIKQNMFI